MTNDIIRNFNNNKWEGNVEDFFKNYGIDWTKYIEREYKLIGKIGRNEIRQCIKTGDKAYIPGSSIKGAIKTAVFYSILDKNEDHKEIIARTVLESARNAPRSQRKSKDGPIRKLLGKPPFNDLFRALQISDSGSISSIQIAATNAYSLKGKHYKIPVIYETIDEYQCNITVKIDDKLQDTNQIKKDCYRLSKKALIESCNSFSKEIVSNEIQQLANNNDHKISSIKEFYKKLNLKLAKLKENECILRIGQGSGFTAMTVYLALKDIEKFYDRLIRKKDRDASYPTTRRFLTPTNNFASKPLGWVKLSWNDLNE